MMMVVENKSDSEAETKEEKTGFRAHLDNANLFDLIQIECAKKKKQVLKIVTQGTAGFLYLSGGRVVHAECMGRHGTHVAFEILNWESGSVREVEKDWPEKETIRLSYQELLIKAVHFKDQVDKDKNHGMEFPEETDNDIEEIVEKSGIKVMEALDMEENQNNIFNHESILSGAVTDRKSGEIFLAKENGEELSATSAYIYQLAQLVGEAFGMEDFQSLEALSDNEKIFVFNKNEKIVGVRAQKNANFSSIKDLL